MRRNPPDYLYPAVFAPVVSLDSLLSCDDLDDGTSFDIKDEAPSPEEILADTQTYDLVERFVGNLSDRERLMVERVHWHGKSQSDVARELGISKMAVSKALARLYDRARKVLGHAEYLSFAN